MNVFFNIVTISLAVEAAMMYNVSLSGRHKRCKLAFGGNVALGDEVHKLELEEMPPVARKRTMCMPTMSAGCCLFE